MRLTVDVKRKDITEGVQEDAQDCPVARAFNRCLKSGVTAQVGCAEDIVFLGTRTGEDDDIAIPIPVAVDRFAGAFDADRSDVEPFSFSLQLPRSIAEVILQPKFL